MAYVAAPVLGRPDVAAAGKLNIVAAGAETPSTACSRLRRDRPEDLARRFAPQQANVLKLAANFMLASAVETLGEAAALVTGHGIDRTHSST